MSEARAKKPALSVVPDRKPRNETPVSAKVIAPLLGHTPNHVYKMARRGEIPSYRWGASVKFYVSDIENWIDAHRVGRAA